MSIVEVIDFYRPDDDCKNVYVSHIPTIIDQYNLNIKLFDVFSCFGLVYEIQILQPNVSQQDDQSFQYAFVKFYSAHCAAEALCRLKGQLVIAGHLLKIKYANRKRRVGPQFMNIAKCKELANFYLGFNGWSIDILSMKDTRENDQLGNAVNYTCRVKLQVRQHAVDSFGCGSASQTWTSADDGSRGIALCRAKKHAFQLAVEDAFRQLLLIVVSDGQTTKVFVEVNDSQATTRDYSPILNVNELVVEDDSDNAFDDLNLLELCN